MMAAAPLCNRTRPCGRPEESEEVRKRRREDDLKENQHPDLNPKRWSSQTRTQTRAQTRVKTRTQTRTQTRIQTRTQTRAKDVSVAPARCGFRSGKRIQFSNPDVRMALIRRTQNLVQTQKTVQTRTQNTVQTKTQSSVQTRTQSSVQTRTQSSAQTRTQSSPQSSQVRSTSSPGPGSGLSCGTRTRSSDRGPESPPRTRTKRRRKIHPSVVRGRGRLRLSIVPEAGRLHIHIHEARSLMRNSDRSCDSYVKLAVTSDLQMEAMKTETIWNNRKPKYQTSFTLCVTAEMLLNRLLVSVFTRSCDRRSCDSRSQQLIGCMSFRISSLISACELSGWFHLLREDYGRSKHLRVRSQGSRPIREQEAEADRRKTPDSVTEPDLNHNPSSCSSTLITSSSCSTTSSTLITSIPSTSPITSSSSSTLRNSSDFSSYLTALVPSSRMTVSVFRGNDGYGFTICCDCPVRVQAVDAGGPAYQSGLHQGDAILQLNGVPVETWKCVDLAHAIRSCPSQIVMVVWRGLPEVRSDGDSLLRPPEDNRGTSRKLLSHPPHSKHGRRRAAGAGVWSGLGVLGSLWGDRKEEPEEEPEEQEEEYAAQTATLKGTRVTSSNGDNYIILSPVNPGGQLLQPVYHDGTGTISRLYQTHPSRGQHPLHDSLPTFSRRPYPSRTSTLPTTSSSAPPSHLNNYQNCTLVQSHRPSSGYGGFAALAPKTLIFPVFVQPLDLCSPDRTLLMCEEMILHQPDLLPAKVTVLIYTDLLLLTREDECGRCNVLQSPLYLNTLQLREVSSEPLQLYLLHSSASGWRCLLSLEASSFQQKVRVRLCLHDNIKLQLVTMEMAYSQQLSDPPSGLGTLTLGQSDLLYAPPSLYSPIRDTRRPASPPTYPPSSPFSSPSPPPPPFVSPPPTCSSPRSPVWKEREEEEEERQQGEGESASETSETSGRMRGRGLLQGSTHFHLKDEESDEELSIRPAVLRRSLSDGSLLQEPRSPRFYSDSTIHRLTRPATFDLDLAPGHAPRPPSVHVLRKQLTREGGTLNHMLLLLNGTTGPESGNRQLRKKTRTLAADVCTRLAFLRRRKTAAGVHGNSLEKALKNHRPSPDEVLKWAEGLDTLLVNPYGVAVFRHFLRSEFSEENLDFWLAVERFKRTRPLNKMAALGEKIYEEFISTNAERQVNVDSSVRESTNQSLHHGLNPASFKQAQLQVFSLMETDSYPRFLKSRLYAQLANHSAQTAGGAANQEG